MKKKLRWLSVGSASLGLLGLVTGCGSASNGSGGQGGGNAHSPIQLTVMSWNVAANTLQEDAKLYEQSHPNVQIHVIVEDSPTNTYTKLNTELASGSGVPDIMSIESSMAPSFLNKFPQSFLNITNQIKNIEGDFPEAKWAALTYNGQIYGIPWDIGPSMVFYRRDLFKEAGIHVKDIKTWNDYIQAGLKLKQHFGDKVKLTAWGSGSTGLFKMMMNEQGKFIFNKQGQITVNDAAGVRALTTMKKMYQDGLLDVVPYANAWNDTIQLFVNNQIATAPAAIWYVGTIEQSAPNQAGKWGVFPTPAFSASGNHAANLGGSNLLISKNTPHPRTALSFAEFCMTNRQALNVSMKYGIFPSYEPYYQNNPLISQSLSFFGGQKVFQMAANEVPNISPAYHTANFEAAHSILLNVFQQAVLQNEPAAQALNNAAQQIANQTGAKIASGS
ncbi:ABC transporter substrate-binding protein [Alicyclobacillus tolerans]|uniref:Lactose/L-arabinose transport system substrate-binding protein n=1 Tax=Alicyclobacillus tolerans TaxID=90970 RepID=A0ABT9LYC1_9BACL|nr:sugar ABC transporter substrate-binding protein [Alicyclobacillus tengchongensis]MDP9729265.1 lactose/L-arabinose transport system substrate-binding protein [Alicyclobacillus tengchongensis]